MTAPTIFISYSHKDEVWKDRLLDHLGGLEEEGFLKVWNDRNIGAGDEWFEEIRNAMDAAQVAVFGRSGCPGDSGPAAPLRTIPRISLAILVSSEFSLLRKLSRGRPSSGRA